MALQVWLPLTKDTRNQGLMNLPSPWEGWTRDSNGKLGQYCYSDCAIYHIEDEWLENEWSLACWVKSSSWGQYNDIMLCKNATTSDAAQFYLSIIGGTQLNIGCNAGSQTLTVNYAFATNTWYHVTATYNGTILKLYLNGNEVGNKTYTSTQKTGMNNFCVGCRSTNSAGTSGTGNTGAKRLNDVRVYNHCLSPMEVKKLSQGLVLHYPLNRNGWGQENLLSRYVVPGQAGPTSTAAGGRTTWLGDYKITIPATENADTYFRLFTTKQLTANATYTISCQVSGLKEGSYYRFPLYAQNNTGMGVLQLDHNGLCSLTFTMTYGTQTAATGANGETVYICFMDDSARSIASGQGAITISDFKLEEGSIATPWCPSSSDALATTMGLNSTIEYDCSGFCNNGTRTGTFTWTSNTPKYAVSQVFNGTDNAIQTPSLPTMITDKNYTIAVWIYKTVIGNKSYQTIYGGPSGFEIEARNGGANETKFVPWNWGKPMASYELNKWNHCVFVHSDADCKIYLNGEYIATGTAKASNPTGDYFIGAWNTATQQNFDGLMSDFRIYATALSADDVKSLYQNCATIDPDGTIRGKIR